MLDMLLVIAIASGGSVQNVRIEVVVTNVTIWLGVCCHRQSFSEKPLSNPA